MYTVAVNVKCLIWEDAGITAPLTKIYTFVLVPEASEKNRTGYFF